MIATIVVKTTTEGQDPLNPSLKTTDTKPDPTMKIRMTERITDHKIGMTDPNTTPNPTGNKKPTIEPKITTEATTDAMNPIRETTKKNKDQDWSHDNNPVTPEVKANKGLEATTKIIVSSSGQIITTFKESSLQPNKLKIISTLGKNPISRICMLS